MLLYIYSDSKTNQQPQLEAKSIFLPTWKSSQCFQLSLSLTINSRESFNLFTNHSNHKYRSEVRANVRTSEDTVAHVPSRMPFSWPPPATYTDKRAPSRQNWRQDGRDSSEGSWNFYGSVKLPTRWTRPSLMVIYIYMALIFFITVGED